MTNASDWFARYKFCQPLGQGGMGTVYLAEDRDNSNIQCVIKQLTNKYSDPVEHAEAVRLFQREAAILRSLNHPGIVRVFDDHCTDDGRYFLVMDYVPGKNLEIMLNTGGPFSAEMTVNIGIQCCEILEYLHCQSPPVIYRDLKPSNLMLTPDGRIVFIDFGIARAFVPKEAATRVVTAGYSPPEQYFGKPETRSDLYALGATLFHLVTGQRPKPLNVCAPGLVLSGVPDSLDNLCRKLTAHNLEDRPPTARAVRFELYKIYKQAYPDFEIPREPGAELELAAAGGGFTEDGSEQMVGRALIRARAGAYQAASNPHDSSAAEGRPGTARMRPAHPPDKLTWWQKLKQWLEIWLH